MEGPGNIAVTGHHYTPSVSTSGTGSDGKVWRFLKKPFRTTTPSSSSHLPHHYSSSQVDGSNNAATLATSDSSVSSVARLLLPARRRLKLDPASKLYFPYEPGKQARSAIRIKNTSKSHVAFKFQTTAPKSCFMRPPGAILAPGESIIATVFKFVEHPENNEKPTEQKIKAKFKILSLKIKEPVDYVPELFDEQKNKTAVEQILRVVFLDPERRTPALEKLQRQLAEADAAMETRKQPQEEAGPKVTGEGLVIDEWVWSCKLLPFVQSCEAVSFVWQKERRERYLARQNGDGGDSLYP